jgi:hypothetical protein
MAADRSRLRDGVREIAWWMLVGVAAGAIAGALIGGVGGRLAMLLLRLTSPDSVIGVTSDDGFEIGVVSFDSVNLLLGMTALGAVNGALYAVVRRVLPDALRLPLWTVFAGVTGGATIVHGDGVDFTLLEPASLAIALFVALPALAAALVVALTERWTPREPWADRRLTVALVAAAILGTVGVAIAVVLGVAALGVRLLDTERWIVHGARVLVPLALCAAIVVDGIELVRETGRIV